MNIIYLGNTLFEWGATRKHNTAKVVYDEHNYIKLKDYISRIPLCIIHKNGTIWSVNTKEYDFYSQRYKRIMYEIQDT